MKRGCTRCERRCDITAARSAGRAKWAFAGRHACGRPHAESAPSRCLHAPQRPWPKWTEHTITVELERFLMGRRDWPRHVEFVAAGQKGLYHAVLKHGGTHAWAARMGVEWIDRRGNRRWTETRIRQGLAEFLSGRDVWPTRKEFIDEGHRALFDAARRFGGIERWRREFGLRPSPQTGPARRQCTIDVRRRNRTREEP